MAAINFEYFPDVFDNIVDNVRRDYSGTVLLPTGTTPYFQFGTYLELIAAMTIADKNQSGKYPLVWLVWDSEENKQNWVHSQLYKIDIRVFIVCKRGQDLTPEYVKENFMKPVLYPIWNLLRDEIFYHENIESTIINQHVLREHTFWGQEYQSKIFDTLSALEIKYNQLNVMKTW